MTTLAAPDAPFRLTAPIEHITELPDGSLLVHCTVTSETPDSQGDIVDYDAAKEAAPALMKWATLGEMHDPERMDAGTILQLHFDDANRRIEADLHVVDPTAVKKVRSRTYKAVSMGGDVLATRRESIGGRLVRRLTKLVWDEVSLVNRGANPDALIAKQFVLAKRAAEESDMAEHDAGTVSPFTPAPSAPERRTPEQIAIDDARAALAKGDIHQEASDAAQAKLPKARRKEVRKMAKKSATGNEVLKAHDTADETPADEAEEQTDDENAPDEHSEDEGAEEADKAKKVKKVKKLSKAQRLAKRVGKLRKANRRLAKAKRRLTKRSGLAGLTRTLAKAGARNSGKDAERIAKIHDLTVGLGFSKCMTKSAGPETETIAPIAKADAPVSSILREALTGLVPLDKLEAIEARLADQGEQLAKIAKSPTGGGPASSYAPVFRDQPDATSDRATVLAKAAEAIDDPRLREQVGHAAALEMISRSRG